jgi:hypothetical protein
MTEFWLRGLTVFICAAIADFLWAKYIPLAAMKRRHWFRASFWGANIMIPGFIGMINGVEDHRMLVFSYCGAFIGTALTLRLGPED